MDRDGIEKKFKKMKIVNSWIHLYMIDTSHEIKQFTLYAHTVRKESIHNDYSTGHFGFFICSVYTIS